MVLIDVLGFLLGLADRAPLVAICLSFVFVVIFVFLLYVYVFVDWVSR